MMADIYSKLMSVQSELKAPKGQFNKFGGYSYRSCEDILEALKPVLAKYQAAVTVSDELVMIGSRFYVKATAMFHADGETVSTTAYAREAETKKGMDESQITGSASSYARKYALNGLMLIDDNKDADTNEQHTQTSEEDPTQIPSSKISKGQIAKIQAELRRTGVKPEVVCQRFHVAEIADLTESAFPTVMDIFAKTPDKAA